MVGFSLCYLGVLCFLRCSTCGIDHTGSLCFCNQDGVEDFASTRGCKQIRADLDTWGKRCINWETAQPVVERAVGTSLGAFGPVMLEPFWLRRGPSNGALTIMLFIAV